MSKLTVRTALGWHWIDSAHTKKTERKCKKSFTGHFCKRWEGFGKSRDLVSEHRTFNVQPELLTAPIIFIVSHKIDTKGIKACVSNTWNSLSSKCVLSKYSKSLNHQSKSLKLIRTGQSDFVMTFACYPTTILKSILSECPLCFFFSVWVSVHSTLFFENHFNSLFCGPEWTVPWISLSLSFSITHTHTHTHQYTHTIYI